MMLASSRGEARLRGDWLGVDERERRVLAERREKLKRLRDLGIEPFPHAFEGRTEIAEVRAAHEGLAAGAETDDRRRVAGRIAARRGHGRRRSSTSSTARAGSSSTRARTCSAPSRSSAWSASTSATSIGAEGIVFATKRGELSLRLDSWTLLAKSLRPPPDKYHGLEDVELRYRHRELDLIANAEVRELFAKRARAVAAVREWLDEHGFLEVETPVLQPLYGGALARPFTTHHNALDRDLYLRIATELYLKRCVIGGIERVYELGKDFRNEGISPKHNPEFTMLEWYEAYADYTDAAERLEQLVAHAAERVLGTTRSSATGRRSTSRRPGAGSRCVTRSRSGPGSTSPSARPARSSPRRSGSEPDPGEGWGKLVDGVLSKLVEPSWSNRPSCSTTRSSCRRSPSATAPRRGWSSASRPSSAGSRSPTRSPS